MNAVVAGGFTGLGSTAIAHIANSQLSIAALAPIGLGAMALIPPLLYLNYLRSVRAEQAAAAVPRGGV